MLRFLVAAAAIAAGAGATPPPHVIVAMVDDLGWNGLGFNTFAASPTRANNTEVKTPYIDALAQGGVILDNFYVYKFCSPTRASFLTGRLPGHGIQLNNLGMTSAVGCNLNLTMIPAHLKAAGYRSAQVGKWHQGFFNRSYTPRGRGFDSSFGFLGGGEDHLSQCHACENSIPAPDYATAKFDCPASFSPCGEVCPAQGGVDLYCTDKPCYDQNTTANPYLYAREMTRLIGVTAADSKPLFVFLALHNVHQPVESPKEFYDLYPASGYNSSTVARRVYNGMHSGVEFVVKNVTEELKAKKLWDNTILFLFADNGGTFEHGHPVPGSSNYPLRGHKYSFYEGGVRAAAFVASPLLPQAVRGTTRHALLHVSDMWPTLAALAGLPTTDNCPGCVPMDGLDAWPSIVGKAETPRTELLIGVGSKAQTLGALIQGDFKLIAPGGNSKAANYWGAQYPGSTPFIQGLGNCDIKPCLFNLKKDPRETTDLVDSEAATAANLLARYKVLSKQLYAPNSDSEREQQQEEERARCDHDDCWESGMLYRGGAVYSPCLLDGNWFLGGKHKPADVFSMSVSGANQVAMTIKQGCASCAFTRADGTVDGTKLTLVATGKSVAIQHIGTISPQGAGGGCRIHWTSHNSTKEGDWADFCKGKACAGGPPPPPKGKSAACKKMLAEGYWQPWQ